MDGRIKCGHDGGALARLAHVPAVGWISAFAGMSGERAAPRMKLDSGWSLSSGRPKVGPRKPE
jgi:hypothetical protein